MVKGERMNAHTSGQTHMYMAKKFLNACNNYDRGNRSKISLPHSKHCVWNTVWLL